MIFMILCDLHLKIQNKVHNIIYYMILDSQAIVFAALGGFILGIATTMNYVLRGKVTGMSGIVFGVVSLNQSEMPQKLSIIGGMFFISSLFYLMFGEKRYSGFDPYGPQNQMDYWTTFLGFAIAGFLVGFGTKLSNGCTSGHGLCGISRFSLRSIVAVCTFLFTAIGFSTLIVNTGFYPFVDEKNRGSDIYYNHTVSAALFLAVGLVLPGVGYKIAQKYQSQAQFSVKTQIVDQMIVFMVGVVFAVGLMTSGMTRRKNILGFLQLNKNWNPALLFVLGCGLAVNVVSFTLMRKKGKSLNGNKVFDPKGGKIDLPLVLGAFCFGLGWGLGGLCPGPFLCLFSVFTIPITLLWGAGLVAGMLVAKMVGERLNKPKSEITQDKQPLNMV